MEKITKSLLALMLMLVGLVSAKAGEAPVPPAAPKASALVTDGSTEQYLFNVGAKGFFIGANDYGTRASISDEKGYWVKITKTGETYTLTNEAKGGNSADCQNVDQIWVDGAGRAGDGKWTVDIAEDGSFKLGNTNVAGFLSVLPSKNDTKLYMSDADEAQNVWIVVSAEDYTNYVQALVQYKKDYVAWFKENYKAGEDISALAPADWAGQGGNYGGLANPAKEKYVDGANAPLKAGEVMTQTIDGLKNGKYIVKLEAAGSYTSGRGFECPTGDGLAVAFANDQEENLPIVDRGWVAEGEQNFYALEAEVTDGTLKYGVKNLADAGNWYVIRLASITMVPGPDAWYTGADFFRFRADKNAAADSPYAAFSGKVEPAWGADPDDPTNGCIICKVPANVNPASQIWMRGTEAGKTIANGSKEGFKITFRVKADGEYNGLESQAHNNWGYKTGGSPFGTLDVTTEWQTVSFVCTGEKAKNDFTDLCFNLSGDAERTFYFDDVQISRGSDWSLAMKLTDKFKPEGKDQNKPATYVADGDYVEVKTLANPVDPWDNQFFIQIADAAPEGKFSMNDQVKLTFQVMAIPENTALETISCDGQFHRSPDGAGYIGNIDGGNVEITKMNDWIDVEKTLVIKNLDATQYCLNLSKDPASITYRFKDIKAEYTRGMDDWYNNNVVVAKDPAVEYEDGKSYEFPAAPYVYDAKGNGYAEVKTMANPTKEWASQIFFTIPENLAGKQVAISMKVKASKAVTAKAQRHQDNTGSTYMDNYPDANIDFTTEWNKVSVIVDTKKENGEAVDIAKCFVLNLAVDAEALTFDFDSLKFEQYFAPVDYGELIEIPLEGTVVMERDFTKETSYTHSPNWANNKDGYTDKLIVGEGLEIVNTADQGMWDSQFFIMEGFNLVGGRDYAVRYTLKYEGDGGDMQINMGDWTNNDQGVETLAAGPIYTQMVRLFPSFKGDATGAHVFFQSGAIKGRMIVEKVEVIDVTPKYDEMDWSDNILKNGDLKGDDMSEFVLKNNDVEDPEMLLAEKSAIGDGFEIGIETAARPTNEDGSVGGNDHDAQFFVRLPYVLPKGTLFNLEFDLYAEEINTLTIAAHAEPGQWKANISSVKTDPSVDAVHFQEYLTAPADMRTIAFNLAVETKATYGFSNFKVQIVKDDQAAIDAATADADATTLWPETLALNEACYAGRTTETEGKGYSEDLVKALTDAIAAGKAALAPADGDPAPTKESLTAAAKAITDAIAALAPKEAKVADLTADMYHKWTGIDGSAAIADPDDANCDYVLDSETGCAYGNSNINISTSTQYADLGEWDYLTIVVASDNPRLFFNQNDVADQGGNILVPVTDANYVVSNENGVIIYDLAKFKADNGFVHLNAIKASAYNTQVNITEMKLATVEPYKPIATAIEGVETAEDAVKDGKYFINGQIVIVKNGVKYNAAGVAIK